MDFQKQTSLEELQKIPGVGKSIAQDLYSLGIRTIEDLKPRNPEDLYRQLCKQTGSPQDRCLLYTFRCAVYFATTHKPKSELLKWWNWKDKC